MAAHAAGRRDEALEHYRRWLPLINHENRQASIVTGNALMKARGLIECDAPRHPFPPMASAGRTGLLEFARKVDAVVLRWGG